ncbi:MAG: hypothetical protein KAH38_06550 [Candidatus Hydrogenedentes bacterium]|nr:hypothetical protein [Candidatus Hydrogenedentota bacterium]
MRSLSVIFLCVIAMNAAGTDDSWKLPLDVKEKALEQNARDFHNILGLYPSQVEVNLVTGKPDFSTLGYCDIAHAVCWTSNYLAGCSYRYAFLKESGAPKEVLDDARTRADEIFEAIYRCQLVTGVRGLQARGYAIGHGESYEERYSSRPRDNWYQGAGEYKDLRWRGDPSHHNYSDTIAGLGHYYDLCANDIQKDRCREAIDALVGYWVDNDFNIWHIGHERKTPILGFTDGETLDMRIMMAIAGAKTAYHATGDSKYQAAYEKLLTQYKVRGLTDFVTEKDFDDGEHVLNHLENLFRIENDPELLAAYRVILEAIWANHKADAQSLFTYIYMGITPDAPGRDAALKQALFSLQSWPTDTTLHPRMSSLHPELKAPYPLYAAAWDNEYIWKGNLLQGDGWLSRSIVDLSVPAADPVVIYAVDTDGVIYQSRDGAKTAGGWRPISLSLCSPARKIIAGPQVRILYAITDKGVQLSLNAGTDWIPLTLPEGSGKVVNVQVDPKLSNTFDVITENGVFRNKYRRSKDIGQRWDKIEEVPQKNAQAPGIQFKAADNGVLKSSDGGTTWELKTQGLDICRSYAVFSPATSTDVFASTPAGLFVSRDRGETWENGHLVLQFIYNMRREIGGAAYIDAYWRGRYYGFISEKQAVTEWQE